MLAQDIVHSLEARFAWAPPWVFSILLITLALAVALALYGGLVRIIRRRLRNGGSFWRPLLLRTRGPARLAICLGAITWAVRLAPLEPRNVNIAQHVLLIVLILLWGWVAMTALEISSTLYLRRYQLDVSDNLLARKHQTQIRILRRSLRVIVAILTLAFALMTIPGVQQFGVSLLAASGAAGIIVGLALQPVLSNLLAGVQIALTQPIRIDDAVVVEGEWGNVEEITSTYVVIRIWDLRRLIVPLKYFLEKPFQNWTRESADLLGVVLLHLDYRAPIDGMREKLKEILEDTPLWNRKVSGVQVTNANARTMEVRILASASNSGATWDLRCLVREKMIAWLQTEHPEALPVGRLDLAAADEPAKPSAPGPGPRVQRIQ